MIRTPLSVCLAVALATVALAAPVAVTNVRAVHRNGQTFVTWTDAAEGEAGASFRYAVYRSDALLTQANLAKATRCMTGVFNNSAKLFGHAFWPPQRLDPKTPTCTIVEGGEPLPDSSGLAVVTVKADGSRYYAVVATNLAGKALSRIVPGQSATAEPVAETVADIRPIKLHDSKTYGRYARICQVTGKKGLPLHVSLHASSGRGGTAGSHGDYYLYFSKRDWGYRDGLPGIFSVQERQSRTDGGRLLMHNREAIVHPSGLRAMETYWFGYLCVPQGAGHPEPRAYNFTERRMLWLIPWVIQTYHADPERVYASGGSMGAWGSSTFAFRHPDLFAAVYPNRPRFRQRGLPSLVKRRSRNDPALMFDGKSDYFERMNMAKFAFEHHGDLPFLGWCCGRRDGFATWSEQVAMVKALTAAHHGFAFAWNDGNHSSGSKPMREVTKYYPATKFARNRSYPAFGNSSIDDDPGPGDPKAGDMEGGINLGFDWTDVVDEPAGWSAKISNSLAKDEMTVDLTPRRCQRFKPTAGTELAWVTSLGDSGTVLADKWGLVTIEKLRIKAGEATVLTIQAVK